MAKRLNKRVVVGLTIVGMVVTVAAGVVMIINLPIRDPEPIIAQAQQFESEGDYDQARQYYHRAWVRSRFGGADTPESNDLMIRVGDLSLKVGEADRAVKAWQQVLMNDPKNEMAQERIVDLFYQISKLRSGVASWRRVQEEAEKLCEINARNFVGLHALGRALIEQRGIKEEYATQGIKNLQEAFEGDKSNPEFASSLARYYLAQSAEDEAFAKQAMDVFETLIHAMKEKATTGSQEFSTAWRYWGQFCLAYKSRLEQQLAQERGGRFSPSRIAELEKAIADSDAQALDCFNNAIAAAPDDVESLIGVGSYWQAKTPTRSDPKKVDAEAEMFRNKAMEAYKHAITVAPDSYLAYIQLASLYFREGKFTDARKVLEERTKRASGRTGYLAWRNKFYMSMIRSEAFRANMAEAELLAASGKPQAEQEKGQAEIVDRAQEIYRDFAAEAEMGAKDPVALFMQARLLMIKKKPYEAIRALEEADTIASGTNPQIKFYLAHLYHRQTGQPGEAEKVLRTILEAYPSSEPAWAMLSQVLVGMGRNNEALMAAQRALAINEDNQQALLALARIYEAERNFEEMRKIQARIGGGEDTTRGKLLTAITYRLKAGENETPDPQLLAESERLLREVLNEEPLNMLAIRHLVSIVEDRPNGRDEIRKVLDKAKSVANERLVGAATATQPAEQVKKALGRVINEIAALEIFTQPDVTEDEKLHQLEQLVKQGDDPFIIAVDLFRLYQGREDRIDDAYAQVKEAHRLRPDDASVVETFLRYAILRSDWATAEELVEKAIKLGLDPADGHFYRGRLLLARDDVENHFSKAEREFREGLEVFRAYSSGYAWLGQSLVGQERNEEARGAFLEAIRLDPRNAVAAVGLAGLAEARGDDDEYKKYLAIAEQLAPNNAWVKGRLAIAEDERDPEQGITRREKVQQEEPDNLRNLYQLGELYIKQSQYDKAQEVYEKCLAIKPKNLQVAQRYANFLIDKDPSDPVAAEQMLLALVDRFKDDEPDRKAEAQILLAAVAEKVAKPGDFAAADKAFLAAAETAQTPNILINIGRYYFRTGRLDKSEEWLRKVVAVATKDDEREVKKQAWRLLVEVLLRKDINQRPEAVLEEIEAYRKAFDDSYGLLTLSSYYTVIGRETQALEYMNQYVTRTPENALGYFRRADINFRRSQWALAIPDYRETKMRSPSGFNYEHRRRLAVALENIGEDELAIAELQSILREESNQVAALRDLYRICMKLKRYMQAENTIMPRAQEDPKNPHWPSVLAEIQVEKGDVDRAIHYALQAAKKSHYDPMRVDSLLVIYTRFKRYDNLLKFVDVVLPADRREHPLVLMRVGVAYAEKKDKATALTYFGKSLDAVGTNLSNSTTIAMAITSTLGMDAALAFFRERLEKRPDERGTKFALTVLLGEKGEYGAQIEKLQELLADLPADDPSRQGERYGLLQSLSKALHMNKQFAESVKVFEQILEINGNDVVALNNLAYLLMEEMNDPKSAEPYARKAAEQAEKEANVQDTLGWNLVLLGTYDEAIAVLRKAIGLDPAIILVHYHVAEGLYRRSQATGSEEDLSEARIECKRAHQLLFEQGSDPGDALPLIVALGEKLGLVLEKELPAKEVSVQP